MSSAVPDGAAGALEQAAILVHGQHVRKLHEPEEALCLARAHLDRACNPVGERDRASWAHDPCGLGHESRLVADIAPGVLTPHEVAAGVGKLARGRIGEDETDLVGESGLTRAQPAAHHDVLGDVHTGHPRDVAEPHEEPHPGAVAAAEIGALHPGADARTLCEIHRRRQAADMDLLPHHELPEVTFRARVHGLDVGHADAFQRLHLASPELAPGRSRDVRASMRFWRVERAVSARSGGRARG